MDNKDKRELCEKWVAGFDIVDPEMRMTLLYDSCKELEELTMPSEGSKIFYDGHGFGEIIDIDIDNDNYSVAIGSIRDLGNIRSVDIEKLELYTLKRNEFTLFHKFTLPEWGRLWQFGNDLDNKWLLDNLQVRSDIGFRIYSHKKIGHFFGVDGSAYDFYEEHWKHLYEARELHLENVFKKAPALKDESHDAKEASVGLSEHKSGGGKVVMPRITKY